MSEEQNSHTHLCCVRMRSVSGRIKECTCTARSVLWPRLTKIPSSCELTSASNTWTKALTLQVRHNETKDSHVIHVLWRHLVNLSNFLWTGLKVLRCCIHCEIVGTIKGEKRFKGAHWHCYRCRNGFNRRDEAIKHYKTHFRNPHTTFQIQVTQVKVDKPGLNLFSTLDKAFFDHVSTCAVLECELPTVLRRELRGSC